MTRTLLTEPATTLIHSIHSINFSSHTLQPYSCTAVVMEYKFILNLRNRSHGTTARPLYKTVLA